MRRMWLSLRPSPALPVLQLLSRPSSVRLPLPDYGIPPSITSSGIVCFSRFPQATCRYTARADASGVLVPGEGQR